MALVWGSVFGRTPQEFVTTFGLALPGARVSLKVFVILTTGNEAGSATVVVQRPV